MPPNVKVCINGFVLSTLLFDCTNNTSDQEGFLYGSITRNVRREISDHSMSNTQEDILISICSSVPSGSFLSFYNNVGEIKRDDLEYNLAERAEVQNIVGWYRFRRYSAMFPSVREQSTHRHLRELFNSWDRLVDTSYFVFGILSSSNLPNYATHSYDYGFFIQRRDGTFKDLPLTILNLGDTRNSYRAGSMALPFMNSSSFNSVLSSSWNFDTFFDTENQIHEFHQRLRAKLDSLQEELAASDAVNASLEDDIKRISNEMQSLLATQERLACAAAAAAEELEQRERNADTKRLECADIEKEEELKENDLDEETVTDTKKTKIEISDEVVRLLTDELINKITEVKMLDVNEEYSESGKDDETFERKVTSKDNETVMGDQECDSCDTNVDHENVKENELMDYSDESKSPCLEEKPPSPSGFKRALMFPSEDALSTKRVCPDKYFENEEYLNAKALEKSTDEVVSVAKLDESALSTCHKKANDSDNTEMPSEQNKDLPFEVSSCVMEESKISSPASNVEIVISDTGLQSFESPALVDESMASSDELPVVKGSDVKAPSLVSDSKSSDVSENSKSLSDSDICCKTEVLTSDRCGSAPAGFINHATSSSDEKLIDEGINSKNSQINQSAPKISPPFIIYAAKKSENDPLIVSTENLQIHETKSEESPNDKVIDESNQSRSTEDEESEQKSDVPQGSIKKVE